MAFEPKPTLPGAWRCGHNDDLVWLQFFDPNGKPEFTIQRKRNCLNVEYIVHKIPEELGCDLIVPFCLQDYSGEEYVSCDGTGFLVTNGEGGVAFRTGHNDLDNTYAHDKNALEKITDAFCFVVIDTEYIIPIDEEVKKIWKQFLLKKPVWSKLSARLAGS